MRNLTLCELGSISLAAQPNRKYLKLIAIIPQAPELILVTILDVTRRSFVPSGLYGPMYLQTRKED